MNWVILAKKFMHGFKKSDLSQKGMGITDSEGAGLRRMIRESGYKGSLAFFICKKVNEEFFDRDNKKRKMVELLRKINLDTPSDDDLVDAVVQIRSEIGSIDDVISVEKNQDESVEFCKKVQDLQMSI